MCDRAHPPYILCKAGSTKNRKEARQYLRPDLAAEWLALLKGKNAGAAAFNLPSKYNMAAMLRDDLADARAAWLKEAEDDSAELEKRTSSDFLPEKNHEGEVLDFHSLRHTCGAWLAMAGANAKVQTVMRHSTIVLTMDTYAHMVPGQEALTVARFPSLDGCPIPRQKPQPPSRLRGARRPIQLRQPEP